jgi:hypothetical protein
MLKKFSHHVNHNLASSFKLVLDNRASLKMERLHICFSTYIFLFPFPSERLPPMDRCLVVLSTTYVGVGLVGWASSAVV